MRGLQCIVSPPIGRSSSYSGGARWAAACSHRASIRPGLRSFANGGGTLRLVAALTSRGFDLAETRVSDPGKAENLIGLPALASGGPARLIGEERVAREGPSTTKSHRREERSLFRYGLDRPQNTFSAPEPQNQAFFRCLSVLRSPSAFIAGGSAALH